LPRCLNDSLTPGFEVMIHTWTQTR
jgi:hypothetical protein